MKAMRPALAAVVLGAAACASNAGVWNDSFPNMDAKMLRSEITKTLAADAWVTFDDDDKLVADRRDTGGHQTRAIFTISSAGKGSSYEMLGKSGHIVNWLSFGILGAATKRVAIHSCTAFVEKFQADHPHTK